MKLTILFFILISLLVISCNSTQENNLKSNSKPTQYKIEAELNAFLKQNPTWNNNDVSKENFYQLLSKEFNPKIKTGIMDDLPFEFAGVEKFSEKGKIGYLGIMNFDKGKQKYESLSNKFVLSILVFLDQAAVDTLKQGNFYFVKGEFKSFKNDKYLIFETSGSNKEIESIFFPMPRIKVTEIRKVN